MKNKTTIRFAPALLGFWLVSAPILCPAANTPAVSAASPKILAPSAAELQKSIDRAAEFLLKSQNSNGWWSTPEQPAMTALVLTALNFEPSARFQKNRSSELARAYDFILTSAQPDGSIQRAGLANYNTALCLTALASANDPNFMPVILNARRYLASSQIDMGVKGTNDTPFDGGIGYGSKYQHSDMNNTLLAIEAMRLSEAAVTKMDVGSKQSLPSKPEADVDWAAVIHFLENCQNLSSVNKADWVSDEPNDRGGFVYYPGYSNGGSVTNPTTGRVALRSYGSMSYGGLLSYIYARLDKNDPRVIAALDWLRANYTIAENPGMGQQGYYYYLHLMTKALAAAGVDKLKLADGRELDWRAEVGNQLIKLQKPDGSWVNPEKRFWETDPVLVTTYSMMALEILHAHAHQTK